MITPPELPDVLQKLLALGRQQNIDVRPVLLRIVTDLYAGRETASAEATREYEDLALRLLEGADETTLLAVARRLASVEQPPLGVLDRIVARGGEPALVLLRESAHLSRDRLLLIAEHGSSDLAVAVAARSDLERSIVATLATRPERAVLLALAKNPAARFEPATYRRLVAQCRRDLELASALADRAPDAEEAAPLFLAAGPAVRAEILKRMRVVDQLASRRDVDRDTDETVAREIEAMALAGERTRIVDALAAEMGCSAGDLALMLGDPSGEAIAVLLSAAGVTAPVAGRILMSGTLMVPASVRQVHDLVAVVAALSQQAARRLVAAMAGQGAETRRPAHVPVYEAGSPVRGGRPAVREAGWNGVDRRRAPAPRKTGGE